MKNKNNTIITDANILLQFQQKKLEDTEEALRRCRLLLASEQELNVRLINKLKAYD